MNVLIKCKLRNKRLSIWTRCNQYHFHCIIDFIKSCLLAILVILSIKELKTLEWNIFVRWFLWNILKDVKDSSIRILSDLWVNPKDLTLLNLSDVKHILIRYLGNLYCDFSIFFLLWHDEEAELWHQDYIMFLWEISHLVRILWVFGDVNTGWDTIFTFITHIDFEVYSAPFLSNTSFLFRCRWESRPVVNTIVLKQLQIGSINFTISFIWYWSIQWSFKVWIH